MSKPKQFKDLTIKGQKMRIINDAIAQINAKKFLVKNGAYLNLINDSTWSSDRFKGSLKTLIPKKGCECCAKGAILASCVLNVNKLNNEEWHDTYNQSNFLENKLKKWFTIEELALMETAFEIGVVGHEEDQKYLVKEDSYYHCNDMNTPGNYEESTEFLKENKKYLLPIAIKAIKFGRKYKKPENRLLAILENIKINKTFKP